MLFSNICIHLLLISMEVLFFIIQFIYNISIFKFFTIDDHICCFFDLKFYSFTDLFYSLFFFIT